MVTRYEQEEARAAQQKVERVQEFLAELGWNLGKARLAPSLAVNDLYVVEYVHVPLRTPPRLRDTRPPQTFLADMATTRLSGRKGFLSVFSSPEPVIEAAIEGAEATLGKALATQKLSDGCQLEKDIAELHFRVGQLVDAGDHKALAKVAAQLDEFTTRMAAIRTQRDAAVRDAQAKLDAAKADRELLKQAEHRYLRIERDAWNSGIDHFAAQSLHERSERIRAVDACKSIDLNEWNEVDVERAPMPLPVAWLELLKPVELPDIKAWVSERYVEIDAGAPASAGIAVSALHRVFLEAHDLHATQCPIETFGKTVGEVFARKRASSGPRLMLQLKLTEAQREARLRAQFEAEKAAKEAAEFAEWKRARTAATDPAAE